MWRAPSSQLGTLTFAMVRTNADRPRLETMLMSIVERAVLAADEPAKDDATIGALFIRSHGSLLSALTGRWSPETQVRGTSQGAPTHGWTNPRMGYNHRLLAYTFRGWVLTPRKRSRGPYRRETLAFLRR